MLAFVGLLVVCFFGFLTVVGGITIWTRAKKQQQEAYYRAESLRRMAEIPGDGARYVAEHIRETMREEERIRQAVARAKAVKQIETMKMGGLVNIAAGVGIAIFLFFITQGRGNGGDKVFLVGIIPALIGVAMLTYAMYFAPKIPAANEE
jgi:uncharacterized membrane protein YidH (DUF202 family)